VTPLLQQQNGETTDAAGHVWRIHDLRATTVVIMLFTMVFTSMLAALRLACRWFPSIIEQLSVTTYEDPSAWHYVSGFADRLMSDPVGSSGSATTKRLTRPWKLAPWTW